MGIDKSLLTSSTIMLLLKLLEEKDMYGYMMIEELSKKSGVSRTTISELETQKTERITNITLENLAKALNRKVTEIFFTE